MSVNRSIWLNCGEPLRNNYWVLPAVYEHGALGRLVLHFELLMEGQERCGIVWYSMVRPRREVKLSYF